MYRVQIRSENGKTHLILNGNDISKDCYAFSISQDGPSGAELRLTLGCGELDIDMETEKLVTGQAHDKSAPTLADALP